MERAEFLKQTIHMLQRVCALSEMASAEGLLALEAVIDGPEKEHRDILEYGLRFVVDGTDPNVISGILSGLIAQEQDGDKRRLKEMRKEAVLCIQEGQSIRMLLYKLMSHIDKYELKAFRENHADTFASWSPESLEEETKEFPEQAAHLIAKLVAFGEKAGREGLLSLEAELKNLEEGFLKDALRLMIDGTDSVIIDRLLSNRIALEQDEDARRLKIMQKEAVLGIKEGQSAKLLFLLLLSRIDSAEFGTVRKFLPDMDSFSFLGATNGRNVKQANKKKKGFLELVAQTVMNAAALCEKAGKEGFSALEDDLEELDDEFLQRGMRLVLDGIEVEIIDRFLSNQIDLEQDEDARRLKTIQKEAVLCIKTGVTAGMLLHKLLAHIDNFELETLLKAHPDIFEDRPEKFPCGGDEAPDEEVTGFVKRLARIVRRACEFSDKARGEGLLALKEIIDESKAERRDIFEYGIQLAMDTCGSAPKPCFVDRILSTLISHNCDDETRRLKIVQKEAVLGILAGENTRMFLHSLLSHIDNAELDALRRGFSYTYISEEFPGRDDIEDEESTGFVQTLARIVQRACEFSEKARKEGLLALDDIIDEEKAERRDIFEYGIQLMVNGTDCSVTRKILSNMVNLERDNDTRSLMEVQKEAVLCIYGGLHPIEFLHILISGVTNPELEALRKSAPEIFRKLRYGGGEGAEEAGGETMLPEKSFWILKGVKDALEKSLGSGKAIDIASRLASSLMKDEDPTVVKEIKNSIFMFEDILMLDDLCIQKVLRETDIQELAAALRGVDAVVQNRIFRNMSARAAAMLKDRIVPLDPVKQEDDAKTPVSKLETFEDIVMLDDKTIQKLLLELDSGELGKALKNANASIQNKIFKNMSKRTSATIKREIENMTGTVNRKNVEAAQKKVIAVIRHLADSGEIAIAHPFVDPERTVKEARQKVVSLILRLEGSGEIHFCH